MDKEILETLKEISHKLGMKKDFGPSDTSYIEDKLDTLVDEMTEIKNLVKTLADKIDVA